MKFVKTCVVEDNETIYEKFKDNYFTHSHWQKWSYSPSVLMEGVLGGTALVC